MATGTEFTQDSDVDRHQEHQSHSPTEQLQELKINVEPNYIPRWEPRFTHQCQLERVNLIRTELASANIHFVPNYQVFERWVMGKDSRSLNDLVEYARCRVWLDTWTDYNMVCRQNWRTYGFPSKVYCDYPFISSAEARALQLLIDTHGRNLHQFLNQVAVGIPEKYMQVINNMTNGN